jgi:hypothetical protein
MAKSKKPDGGRNPEANADAAAAKRARKPRKTRDATETAAGGEDARGTRGTGDAKRVAKRAANRAPKRAAKRAPTKAATIAVKGEGARASRASAKDSAKARSKTASKTATKTFSKTVTKTSSKKPSMNPLAETRGATGAGVKLQGQQSVPFYIPLDGAAGGGAIAAPLALVEVYDLADLKTGGRLAPIDPTAVGYGAFFDLTRELLRFYRERFGRESYDGNGARLAVILNDFKSGGSLHDDTVECLRFSETWSGRNSNGVAYEFSGIPLAPEYLAHEFQHAVTCACSSLNYRDRDQAALHESLSDVFAITFRHWLARPRVATPIDWRFGSRTAKFVGPGGQLVDACTRNLAAPGAGDAWETGRSSIGAVTNTDSAYAVSLVPSHAFRRVTARLGEDQDAAKAIDEAARVWYAALASAGMRTVRLIQHFANLTASAAQALDTARGGANTALLAAVLDGWDDVGVRATPGAFHNPALIASLVVKPTGFA